MKISKLLAVAALACAAALFISPSAFAATADPLAGPILSYEDIVFPAVCAVIDVNAEAVAMPMAECSAPMPASKPVGSFLVLASLEFPASIYELPLYVHFDPGRVGAAVA